MKTVYCPEKVIIFLLSGLGDTLMFTPALRMMRLVWNHAHIAALTMRASERDVLQYNRDLNRVFFWPFFQRSQAANLKFIARFRKMRFDASILPCPSNRIHYNIASFLCGARTRVGFHYLQQSRCNLDFLNTILFPHRDHVHNAEHNIALVESLSAVRRQDVVGWSAKLSLPTIAQDRVEADRFLEEKQLKNGRCVGLHISSSRAKHMERKCWSKEHFLELIQVLRLRHQNLKFILFCGEEDFPESDWLSRQDEADLHLALKLPIRTVAEIIRSCCLFITNDSGLLHVASIMETPTIAIFGPTNPRRSGPWMMNAAEVVRTGISCSPCFYHTSHDLTCPAQLNFACLSQLSARAVAEIAERLLK